MHVENLLFLKIVFMKNLKRLLFQIHFIDILNFDSSSYLSAPIVNILENFF